MRHRFMTMAAFFLALAVILAPAVESLAASRGSFSSGGSRSYSSGSSSRSGSSSGGWSNSTRPSAPSPSRQSAPQQQAPSAGGWSGTARQAEPGPAPPAAPGWSNSSGSWASSSARNAGTSAFSRSGADAVRHQEATRSYQGYQGLYSKPGNPVNPGQVTTSKPILDGNRTFGSYQDYNRYRDNYYAGRGWSAPPYAFGSHSRFGMWDAMFMWFMLSHLGSGSSFFYNHQNDPGVQSFKQEAAKLSESNADLKKQLDEMNAKLEDMKKNGVQPDPTAMPPDVDTNVVLATPAIAEPAKPEESGSMVWTMVIALGLGFVAMRFLRRRQV